MSVNQVCALLSVKQVCAPMWVDQVCAPNFIEPGLCSNVSGPGLSSNVSEPSLCLHMSEPGLCSNVSWPGLLLCQWTRCALPCQWIRFVLLCQWTRFVLLFFESLSYSLFWDVCVCFPRFYFLLPFNCSLAKPELIVKYSNFSKSSLHEHAFTMLIKTFIVYIKITNHYSTLNFVIFILFWNVSQIKISQSYF